MSTLADIYKHVNPDDPTLTGIIPTAATIAGGVIGNRAVGGATDDLTAGLDKAQTTISDAGNRLSDINKGVYEDQKGYYDPYAKLGTDAAGQLQTGLTPGGGLTDPFKYDMTDFENDPARLFALEQGRKQNLAELGRQGIDFSGGAARDLNQFNVDTNNKYFGTDYSRAENTFNTNKQQRLSALQDAVGRGETAAAGLSGAAANYGQQQQQGTEWTASDIAELQAQKADAIASGDLGKAKSITDTIAGVATQIGGNTALSKLNSLFGGGARKTVQTLADMPYGPEQGNPGMLGPAEAPDVAGYGGEAAGSTPADLSTVAKTATGVGGTAATTAAGSAPLTGYAGGGLVTSHGAAIGMLTNPITIGIGAGVLAVTALLKSAAHYEANTITTKFQKPFDDNMAKISDQFAQLKASGQLTPEAAQQTQQAVQGLAQAYMEKLDEYASKGKDYKKVTDQAKSTFAKYYTPQFFGQFTA